MLFLYFFIPLTVIQTSEQQAKIRQIQLLDPALLGFK
jgi:hypothetical protein